MWRKLSVLSANFSSAAQKLNFSTSMPAYYLFLHLPAIIQNLHIKIFTLSAVWVTRKQGSHFQKLNKPNFQKYIFAPTLEEHNSSNIWTRLKRKPISETTVSLLLMHNLHYANFKSCKISKCLPASPLWPGLYKHIRYEAMKCSRISLKESFYWLSWELKTNNA